MKSIYFTQEHQQFRGSVKDCLQYDVVPYIDQWESDRQVGRDCFRKLGANGLLGLHYDLNYGGLGKDFFHTTIFLEELGRLGYAGFRTAIAVHAYMALPYLEKFASQYLQQKYFCPAVEGKKIVALALTEPQAGSDLASIQTQAMAKDGYYLLNGTKKYIANGSIADFYLILAKTGHTPTDMSVFCVDANNEGIKAEKLDMLGWHASDTAEISFSNVKVPNENIVGKKSQGFMYTMKCMQLERLVAAILALGGVDHTIKLTWEYVSGRKAFNQPLKTQPAIRRQLADMVSELEAYRQLAYAACWSYQRTRQVPFGLVCMLKYKCTDLANRAAQLCLQMHGARGYEANSDIARVVRDTPAAVMAAGANDIMAELVTQFMLDECEWGGFHKEIFAVSMGG